MPTIQVPGKTIMAGLLLEEMKIRGLVKRTLIITPANLTFQWQRELKDRFRESFEIVRGDVLRAKPGHHVDLMGVAGGGCPGEPASKQLGPDQIDSGEWDFYDALTRYVEDQSIRAKAANSTTGRAVGFAMAMPQRRFASSVFAARRSLERMRDKRQHIL